MIPLGFKNILIVDDDVADVYLLQKALRQVGMDNIVSVGSGEEAAKYITGLNPFGDRRLPNLIFLDLKLGAIDGLQFVASMARNSLFNQIPIIVVSGSTDPTCESRVMELGAKAWVQKTADIGELKANVEKALKMIKCI